MPTHTDNRHYGKYIGEMNITGDLNVVDAGGSDFVFEFLPLAHDLSDQLDGQTKQFNLNPPIRANTTQWVAVYIDGQLLTQGADDQATEDYYIPGTRTQIVLTDSFGNAPLNTSALIVYYIEEPAL